MTSRSSERVWLLAGLGILGAAAVTAALCLRHQRLQQARCEERDPRAAELRALIVEAEGLLHRGRRRATGTSI